MSQNCHSFYNLLTDNPVAILQEEYQKAAANIENELYFSSSRKEIDVCLHAVAVCS